MARVGAADEFRLSGDAGVAAGWGGVVWKTLCQEPIVNVTSRFAGLNIGAGRMLGMNNIELITDRPLDVNLREIAECKAAYPDRAIVASLMTDCTQARWHELVLACQTADGGFSRTPTALPDIDLTHQALATIAMTTGKRPFLRTTAATVTVLHANRGSSR